MHCTVQSVEHCCLSSANLHTTPLIAPICLHFITCAVSYRPFFIFGFIKKEPSRALSLVFQRNDQLAVAQANRQLTVTNDQT